MLNGVLNIARKIMFVSSLVVWKLKCWNLLFIFSVKTWPAEIKCFGDYDALVSTDLCLCWSHFRTVFPTQKGEIKFTLMMNHIFLVLFLMNVGFLPGLNIPVLRIFCPLLTKVLHCITTSYAKSKNRIDRLSFD